MLCLWKFARSYTQAIHIGFQTPQLTVQMTVQSVAQLCLQNYLLDDFYLDVNFATTSKYAGIDMLGFEAAFTVFDCFN